MLLKYDAAYREAQRCASVRALADYHGDGGKLTMMLAVQDRALIMKKVVKYLESRVYVVR